MLDQLVGADMGCVVDLCSFGRRLFGASDVSSIPLDVTMLGYRT